jgi:hypothetical protein
MLIGLANVGLGIFIFCFTYKGDFAMWAGLCAAGLCSVSLLQYITDRQEKYAILRNDREMMLKARDDDGFDGEGDVNGRDGSAPLSPHKPFPGNVHEQSLESPSEAYPAAAGHGYSSGSHSRYHNQDDAARPGGTVSGSGVTDAGRNVKLTANLLQQHQASSRGGASAAPGSVGQHLSQAGFAGFERQPGGGGDHAEWDQGQNWQQQQQQYMLQQQQVQVQQMAQQQQLLHPQVHLQQQQQHMQQQLPGDMNAR